ncbi:Protein NDR1 [Cardamine amara subsp. amara]|uniref:Protein NDR1 n=1 Tax=Cardamine amara subsp. amara TaxID=228776 RepID=A0ABD1A7N0_CARAN
MDQDRERSGGNCCSCCLSFIFTAGLTSLFLWLSLRANKPKCSIQNFYVPALNKTLNSRDNTTLNFMVRCDNPNKDQGIYYDDVHLTISNTNNTTIANYTVPKFYQGHKKKAKKPGQVLPLNNQTVLRAVLPNGSAVFRMDLKTQVRFKIIFWKTKRERIEVGADVEVNGNGTKAQKKGIKMKKSDSSSFSRSSFPICVLMNLLVFFAIR